jgi:hypothetical protein
MLIGGAFAPIPAVPLPWGNWSNRPLSVIQEYLKLCFERPDEVQLLAQ